MKRSHFLIGHIYFEIDLTGTPTHQSSSLWAAADPARIEGEEATLTCDPLTADK